MSWNPYTADDALADLTDAETTAINNFANAKDRMPGIVSDTVATFRAAIAVRQAVGDAGTVPDSIRHYVGHLCLEHYLITCPGVLLTEDRKRAGDEARQALKDLREGKIRVETPDAPSGEAFSRPAISTVQSTTRDATKDKMKGL